MFTIGVNATDLGNTAISWDGGATDSITGMYKAGVAMKLVDGKLIMAGDIGFDGTALGDANVGLEYKVIDELALRGGVVLTDEFQSYNFTVGAGINIAGLTVDAAYIMNETLGNTLVLSADFSLGSLLGGEEVGTETAPTETAPTE